MKLDILVVGCSGFVGSICRYLVYVGFGSRNLTTFPWATFVVNVVGCFLIGIVGTLLERSVPHGRHLYLIGSVGFLGAFTTFSAFGFETITLMRNQQMSLALLNVGANVAAGLAAVVIGRYLVISIW